MHHAEVIIVGAGLSGLACAWRLAEAGIDPLVLEANDRVGGRIRTDRIDGFRLDRGFQALQTAYPEAMRTLDLDGLRLHRFASGALIRTRDQTVSMMDPWRHPTQVIKNLTNGIGNLSDRLRLATLRRHVLRSSLEDLAQEPETTTHDYLRERWRLSQDLIDRFLHPWLSGVFLEDRLETSSRWFTFVFRMFASGDVALPANGMEAIPNQLAERIGPQRILVNTPVHSVSSTEVTLQDGSTLKAEQVVLATPSDVASRLQGQSSTTSWCGTVCRYYAADNSPIAAPLLMIDGDRRGPIRHVCVPNEVAPSYAPLGRSLVSVTSIGISPDQESEQERAVAAQLKDWFGAQVDRWHLLARYRIPQALPARKTYRQTKTGWENGLLRCSDELESSSIHGALHSGRVAAETYLAARATLAS